MNIVSSCRMLIKTMVTDYRLFRRGMGLGWYTTTYLRERLRSRNGGPARRVHTHIKVDGQRLRLHLTGAHASTMSSIFLDDEYDLRPLLATSPDTILDLGANAGMAAAYFHAIYPRAKFICVEPDPRNLPLLEQTIRDNGVDAQIVPEAISAEAGELTLRFGDNPTCSALETSPMHDLASGVKVTVTTVPALLEKFGWSTIDLLKIDIEGTEKDLLERENGWLERVGAIVLEIRPNTSEAEIGDFLKPFGFTLKALNRGIEPVYVARRKCKEGLGSSPEIL